MQRHCKRYFSEFVPRLGASKEHTRATATQRVSSGILVLSMLSVPSNSRRGPCAMRECAAAVRKQLVCPIGGGTTVGMFLRPDTNSH